MQQRFLLQILLLAQHVSGTTMPIIRSSRVLYTGCCLWYFVLWFFKLLVWCGAEGYVSGLQDACWFYFHTLTKMHGQNHIKFEASLVSQEIPRLVYKSTVHFCIHNFSDLSQIHNSVHYIPGYFLNAILILSFRTRQTFYIVSSFLFILCIIIIIIIIIIIGIQPLGRSGQRPEFSQATGMALVRCILCKFLRVICHCFPPLFRCSHFLQPGAYTYATK